MNNFNNDLITSRLDKMKPFKMRKGLGAFYDTIGGVTVYKLYDTFILNISAKYMKLNSGNHKTTHTKRCLNDNLPDGFTVFQADFVWYLNMSNGETVEFKDDMIVDLSTLEVYYDL